MKPIASRPELPLRVAGAGLETTRLISRGRSSAAGAGYSSSTPTAFTEPEAMSA